MTGIPTYEELEKRVAALEKELDDFVQVETKLFESENRFRMLAESTFEGILIHEKARIIDVNQNFAEMFGYERSDLIGMDAMKLIAPESRQLVRTNIRNEYTETYEAMGLRKDGSTFIMEINARMLDFGGKRLRVNACRDITDRHQAEESLRRSERKYRNIFNNAQVGIFRTRISDGKVLDCNDRFALNFGYKNRRECIEDAVVSEFYTEPGDREKMLASITEKGEINDFEASFSLKNGKNVWMRFTARAFPEEGYLEGIGYDITEEKRALEALRESEQKYRTLSESSLTGIVIHQDGKFVFVNDRFAHMHGYSEEELLGKDFLELIHPDQRETIRDRAKRRLKGEKVPQRYELKRLNRDGTAAWQEIMVSEPITYRGRPAIMSHSIDITDRKQAEEALRQSEEKYRNIFNNAQVGIFRTRLSDGKVLDCNDRFARTLGYKTRQECIDGAIVSEHYTDPARRAKMVASLMKRGEIDNFDACFSVRDGEEVWIRNSVRAFPEKGYLEGIGYDITEEKRALQALRESEQKYRTLTDSAITGIFIHQDGRFVFVNEGFARMHGYAPEEMIEMDVFEVIHPDQREMVRDRVKRRLKGEKVPHRYEIKRLNKDGTAAWQEIMVSDPITYRGRAAIMGHAVDVTERKIAEEALRRGKEFTESLIDTAQVIILMLDPVGRIVRFNSYMGDICGYKLEEVRGRDWFTTFFKEEDQDRIGEVFRNATNDIQTWGNVNAIVAKDGREIIVEWYDKTLKDEDGNIIGIITVGHDITERKRAEDKIRASLKEKEILLREIHHRVKNNMQVIISLMRLQSDRIKEKKYIDMFRESEARIKSMALTHEMLYRSQDFADIDFCGYVRELVNGLFVSHGVDPDRIVRKIQIKDISLGLDHAIPCGLIINELVSYAIKYAFPEEKEGQIRIGLQKSNEDEVELTVDDNGIGMPENLDFEAVESLGLELVKVLAEHQLGGRVELAGRAGTSFSITFPAETNQARL